MDYRTTFTYTSHFDPDVTFEIRKPSYGAKLELDRLTADFRKAVRDIGDRLKAIQEQQDVPAGAWRQQQLHKIADAKIALASAASDAERAEIRSRIEALEMEKFPIDPKLEEQLDEIETDSLRIRATMYNPVRIRWGCAAIHGLTIDGVTADVDLLIEKGPAFLVGEILGRISEVADELSAEQLKNSVPPSTSSAADGGETSDSTATPAAPDTCTDGATASA